MICLVFIELSNNNFYCGIKKHQRSDNGIEKEFSMSNVYLTIAKPLFKNVFAFYNQTTASTMDDDDVSFKCSVNNRIPSILNLIFSARSLNWIIYIVVVRRVRALTLLMI